MILADAAKLAIEPGKIRHESELTHPRGRDVQNRSTVGLSRLTDYEVTSHQRVFGTWAAQPALTAGLLPSLSGLHAWVGLKNSDDIGTKFDLRAELSKNGILVASGAARCLTGTTGNPALAKEVTVLLGPFQSVEFNGTTDTLSLKLLTRIGTNPDDTKCIGPGGSHNSAAGLRMYFDGESNSSQFGAVTP